jgi:uncharacterized protein (DUF4415 family)
MKKIAAEPRREIDFSNAKRGAVIPLESSKTKISIRLDTAVIQYFRSQIEESGSGNYQTLINDALVAAIHQKSVLDAVRKVVREEMKHVSTKSASGSKTKALAA